MELGLLGYQYIATLKFDNQLQVKDFEDIVNEIYKKLTVLSYAIYKFNDGGITGFLLIAESHIAFHYWIQQNVLTLDIFTCSTKEVTEEVLKLFIDKLKPTEYITQFNIRTTL